MWWTRRDSERQLREALAQCLEGLSSGVSAQECLSRYPRLAGELAPLLRAAVQIERLRSIEPFEEKRQEALRIFLSRAASARPAPVAALPPRRPVRASGGPSWRPYRRWVTAGAAGAVALGTAIGVLAASLGGGGGRLEPDGAVAVPAAASPAPPAGAEPTPVFTQNLERAEKLIAELDKAVLDGQPIQPGLITELKRTSEDLARALESPKLEPAPALAKLAEVSARQSEVLPRVKEAVPPEAVADVEATIAVTSAIIDKAEVLLTGAPSPTPSPAGPGKTPRPASPVPSPSPSATPKPTPSPVPGSPSPSPTPGASPAASGSPSAPPSITPDTPLPAAPNVDSGSIISP